MVILQPRMSPLMTVADFVDWPGDGPNTRYELVDGVLRTIPLTSDTHNHIAGNLMDLMASQLKLTRPGWRGVARPGIQPNLRAIWNFRVPDFCVACGPSRPGQFVTQDPILIAEVLSPGNSQDTYENVRAYATLSSVKEILVVYSTSMKAELLRRDASGAWPANPDMIEAGSTIALETIGGTIALAECYAGTYLAASG